MKQTLIISSLLVGVLVGAGLYFNSSDGLTASAQSTSTSTADLIQVDEPDPNDTVSSPIQVSGQARGQWYFEATFPVKVYNSNGVKIGEGHATAQGDWMTTNWVPFTGSIAYSNPGTATGTVVFERSNASGLPQNAASTSVPVVFSTTTPGTPDTGGRMFWFLNLDWFIDWFRN